MHSEKAVHIPAREPDNKFNDLAFADDSGLLNNNVIQTQNQLDAFQLEVGKGDRDPCQKDRADEIKSSSGLFKHIYLFNDHQITIVDDSKYIGSLVWLTEHGVRTRICLAGSAFFKLKSTLRSQLIRNTSFQSGIHPYLAIRLRILNHHGGAKRIARPLR